ncbi:CehA/McbA family metallohydrolase [Janthinobacterium sp. Mn2066]|uniref:CehA/McbA family metallohydrolase n=1 Tax=Janthinobacterium sp. Mn2066 TaxID=3395264 RepID=UPI003BD13264
MCRQHAKWMACTMCIGLLMLAWSTTAAMQADVHVSRPEAKEHSELEATLYVPFRAAAGDRRAQGRSFQVSLAYPDGGQPHRVAWTVTLAGSAPQAAVLQQWSGQDSLGASALDINLHWDGCARARAPPHAACSPAPDGLYQLRLTAIADQGQGNEEVVEQQWQLAVDRGSGVRPHVPAFGMKAGTGPGATPDSPLEASPYRVVYANLHSQTNHSDGGGALAACHGAQEPQTGLFGPLDAYAYAQQHGLDVLMASEHNHMYDGSDGTNGTADPAAALALYRTGLAQAAAYTAGHPGFLALYGMEWGVINQGGHLNIVNSDLLLGWERNVLGELLADVETPKSDYAGLYALMRAQGWIGQFNHPAYAGQFLLDGQPLGYSADGDAVMVLCEVMNTSAFSNNDSETETRRSNYEAACNRALEAGYHVAFSSNQDNHCANWGAAYGNRTAVLVAAGTPLSRDSLFEALRARRVFATMDKHARLLLTANGHLMGERFDNHGPLLLATSFSNDAGRQAAAITLFQGVPGRNGTVTPLSDQPSISLTPAPGPHFYFARLIQDDGNVIWSAPIWVMQGEKTRGEEAQWQERPPVPEKVAADSTANGHTSK